MGDSNINPSQNPTLDKRLNDITVKVNKRALEIAKEIYDTCLTAWEIDFNEAHYYYQDKVIDLLEELLYNLDYERVLVHFYSYDRPRAIRITCDKKEKLFKAWLYYATLHIILYLEISFSEDYATVYYDFMTVFGSEG